MGAVAPVRSTSPRAKGSWGSGRPRRVRSPGSPSWLRENLEYSFPILLGGALCVGLALWLDATQAHALGSRLPLWPLVGAVGATLVGGGFALTVVEEVPAAPYPEGDGYLLVERSEWDRLQRIAAPARPPSPVPGLGAKAPGAAAASGGAPADRALPQASIDPRLVEQVSEELLRSVPPLSVPSPSEPPAARAPVPGVTAPAPAAMPSPQPRPVAPPPTTATRPLAPPATVVPPSPPPPAWREDALGEFEAVLSQLDRERASPPAKVGAPRPSSFATDRCVTCGALVSSYSEQICVACDRPLCDRCLDRTALEGHPAVCGNCQGSLPA